MRIGWQWSELLFSSPPPLFPFEMTVEHIIVRFPAATNGSEIASLHFTPDCICILEECCWVVLLLSLLLLFCFHFILLRRKPLKL